MTVNAEDILGGGPAEIVYRNGKKLTKRQRRALKAAAAAGYSVASLKAQAGIGKVKGAAYAYEDAIKYANKSRKELQAIQNDLLNAGYYYKTEIPTLGVWGQSDVDALVRAMTDSNTGRVDLTEMLGLRKQAVAAGVRPLFYRSSDFSLGGGGGKGGAKGPSAQRYINITTKRDARANLRAQMLAVVGRLPTEQEYADYLKQLNAKENKIFKTTTYYPDGTVKTTGSEFDREAFLQRYVLKKADFQVEDAEGQLGEFQDAINQLVTFNGLNGFVSKDAVTKYLTQVMKGTLSINDLQQELRNQASEIYTGFSQKLKDNPTLSLKDVASPYLNVYANMLEVGDADIDIKDALSKATITNADGSTRLMTVFEYQKSLYDDPRYQSTSRAAQEAASFGAAFARSMGVNI